MDPTLAPARPAASVESFLESAPLFLRPAWLEAVAPGSWGHSVVTRGDEIAAAMPWVLEPGSFGQLHLVTPPLTPSLGPWLRPSTARPARRLGDEHALLSELIAGLPPHALFLQKLHPAITNGLPFHWEGFELRARYTYVLEGLEDEDALWSGFRDNVRREIRKARSRVEVRVDSEISPLLELHHSTLARQGIESSIDEALLGRALAAAREEGFGQILVAVDERDRVHAGGFFAGTAQGVYYLLGGSDPAHRTSGAMSLVMWEAIRRAAGITDRFDFEGSMLAPVERYFRAFGGRQVPYLEIERDRRPGVLRVLKSLKRIWATR